MARPSSEHHSSYFKNYVDLVTGEEFLSGLQDPMPWQQLQSLTETQWSYRYAADKWSVKQLILHVSDAERVFAYRALRLARHDKTALPGFDQDLFVDNSRAEERSGESLINEFKSVRQASIHLYDSLSAGQLEQMGDCGGAQTTVNALGFVTLGHQIHHFNILSEKYSLWK